MCPSWSMSLRIFVNTGPGPIFLLIRRLVKPHNPHTLLKDLKKTVESIFVSRTAWNRCLANITTVSWWMLHFRGTHGAITRHSAGVPGPGSVRLPGRHHTVWETATTTLQHGLGPHASGKGIFWDERLPKGKAREVWCHHFQVYLILFLWPLKLYYPRWWLMCGDRMTLRLATKEKLTKPHRRNRKNLFLKHVRMMGGYLVLGCLIV